VLARNPGQRPLNWGVPAGTQLRTEQHQRFVLDSIQHAARTKVRSNPTPGR
jgi:hypothetical protein